MSVGPFFKWFGSKFTSAPQYPSPELGAIFETHAGGAGYACNYPYKNVYLRDTDPELSQLWPWLISASRNDILSIPVYLDRGFDIRTLKISHQKKLLIRLWQRVGVDKCWTVSYWSGNSGFWGFETRRRIAEEVSAIRHWKFVRSSIRSFWLIEPRATYFVDPPYVDNHKYSTLMSDDYYSRLRGEINLIQPGNQVIVCEGLGKSGIPPTWLPFEKFRKFVNSKGRLCTEFIYYRSHMASIISTGK